ncbi:MAG: dipeptidase [Bacteroidota bacterium]|nr:dipeptidase [Bacteroidota bacterium]
MLSIDFSIDLHCHPTLKPMGHSTNGSQSSDPNDKSSLWFYDPPGVTDKLLNEILSVTKFSQANFTACARGKVWVIAMALGTIEKWFFNNRLGTEVIADVLEDFATEVGKRRIDEIQKIKDYFKDLLTEFSFLEQQDGAIVNVSGNNYAYKIARDFGELNAIAELNRVALESDAKDKVIYIAVIPTIEGLHVLNCGLDPARSPENIKADAQEVKAHAVALKEHPHRPWFVTFTHHFFNELSGHSESLKGLIAKNCDQHLGIDTGFTSLGREVLNILLDNSDGKRILIDIKHLSPAARKQFFELRRNEHLDIPVIISHGVCNGLPTAGVTNSAFPELGTTFNDKEINFYDDEIIEMVKSNGIMGLQLDERRIASDEIIKGTRHSFFKNKIMHYRSELVWRQIQYVAELLDANGLFAWGNVAIGSDYDGIVDPLNSFWTMEQYPDLKSFLERHAFNYMQNNSSRLKNSFNKISADIIVQNIFQTNAWKFLERWF